jgi:hypothetical protein
MRELQKYCPVMDRDLDYDALEDKGAQQSSIPPQRLADNDHTETKRMRNAKHPVVHPVTPGDRSLRGRVYEKGRKNQTRT